MDDDNQEHMGLIHGDSVNILSQLKSNSVDLTLTSPPYYLGKAYDHSSNIGEFRKLHEEILPEIVRVTADGGSICWQVGYHVANSRYTPLDFIVHGIMSQFENIFLQNRIIWEFGHGHHLTKRFSGRHETILWYTRGQDYVFDLDSVRIPQKYPGKLRYKGYRKGEVSGNPRGKNPSDVWQLPNVKAAHVEKTSHPCQFPIALAQRVIRALTKEKQVILDPFAGSGTTAVAAILEYRNYIAIEIDGGYIDIAKARIDQAIKGTVKHRDDRPPLRPDPSWKVARSPEHFQKAAIDI